MPVTKSVEIFFSYSHRDEDLRNELEKHLASLVRQQQIRCWHDRKIVPGQEWAKEIDEHAKTADVILLLVSADFIDSEYCYDIEVQEALRRHKAKQAVVIPVILRPVYLKGTLFANLQALPKDAKPIVTWPTRDEAFVNVVEGLAVAIERLTQAADPEPAPAPVPPPIPIKERPPAQPSAATTGIEALAELMRSDPRVRDEVVKFKSDFAAVSEQIDVLADYKDLHDLLHELQIHAFNVIIGEARHFPEDAALQNLGEYERRLAQIVERLDQVTAKPSFQDNQTNWMPKLREARQDLTEAIDQADKGKLDAAIELMRGILAKQPSKVDTRMTAKAEDLRLKNLAEAMKGIDSKVTWNDLNLDKLSAFREGAHNLDQLDAKLHDLLEKHNSWQEVDNDLRLIEQFLEQDIKQLVEAWPKLRPQFEPLYGSDDDPRCKDFRAEGDKLGAAIQAKDPRQIRQSFRRFRGHATDRFYAIDKNLRDHCGELRAVGVPLVSILNVLRANS